MKYFQYLIENSYNKRIPYNNMIGKSINHLASFAESEEGKF